MKNDPDMLSRLRLQLDRIGAEVIRASELHKPMNSTHEAYAVILEELDEFWDNVKVNPKNLTKEEKEQRVRYMQTELLQIAAMCVRTTIDCDLMG